MHRSLYIALAVLMFAAAPAQGYELDRSEQRYPVPTRDWKFFQQQCELYDANDGPVACAWDGWDAAADGSYEAEPGTVQEPKGMGASTYHHEEGHLFDFSVLTDAQRAEFLRLVGRQGEAWWSDLPATSDGFDAYDPPGEWFADAYSLCALRATGRKKLTGASIIPLTFRGERVIWRDVVITGWAYGYKAKWPVHQRICQMIGSAAGRHYSWKTGAYG